MILIIASDNSHHLLPFEGSKSKKMLDYYLEKLKLVNKYEDYLLINLYNKKGTENNTSPVSLKEIDYKRVEFYINKPEITHVIALGQAVSVVLDLLGLVKN